MKIVLIIILSIGISTTSMVSSAVADTSSTVDDSTCTRLSVFLDGFEDYSDHLQSVLTYLEFVRNREEADVHAILTSENTAAWGAECTLRLIGLNRLEGMVDTLRWKIPPDATINSRRSEVIHHLQLGLVRYMAKMGLGKMLNIQSRLIEKPPPREDKWKQWVFTIDAMTWFDGEKTRSSSDYMFILTANRTTDEWRGQVSLAGTFGFDRYDLAEGEFLSRSETYTFITYFIKSLGDHWSVGFYNRERQSTYSNLDLSATFSPALEYNLFPYSQSTSRQLRFLYTLKLISNDYSEITIYNKGKEILTGQSGKVSLEFIEPWGSANVWLYFSHYYNDFYLHRLTFYSSLSLRLVRGLSVTFYGDVSMIHDQITLPRAGASNEDILLQRRELETGYDYSLQVGLSYSFGSIYSSVVNTRIDDW